MKVENQQKFNKVPNVPLTRRQAMIGLLTLTAGGITYLARRKFNLDPESKDRSVNEPPVFKLDEIYKLFGDSEEFSYKVTEATIDSMPNNPNSIKQTGWQVEYILPTIQIDKNGNLYQEFVRRTQFVVPNVPLYDAARILKEPTDRKLAEAWKEGNSTLYFSVDELVKNAR